MKTQGQRLERSSRKSESAHTRNSGDETLPFSPDTGDADGPETSGRDTCKQTTLLRAPPEGEEDTLLMLADAVVFALFSHSPFNLPLHPALHLALHCVFFPHLISLLVSSSPRTGACVCNCLQLSLAPGAFCVKHAYLQRHTVLLLCCCTFVQVYICAFVHLYTCTRAYMLTCCDRLIFANAFVFPYCKFRQRAGENKFDDGFISE